MTKNYLAEVQYLIINMEELVKDAERNAEFMEEQISWMINGSRLTIEKPEFSKEEGDRKRNMLSEKMGKIIDDNYRKDMS